MMFQFSLDCEGKEYKKFLRDLIGAEEWGFGSAATIH